MDFEREIARLQADLNKRLDELESKVSVIGESVEVQSMNEIGVQPNASMSSIGSIETARPESIDWDEFAVLIEENQEDAVMEIISYIRSSLARKASTKRMIEKANSQYVDTSFQRVSTQLTALINQKVLQNHNQLEGEIAEVIHEVEWLKDRMAHEFGEIRALIQECRQQKEELERETDFPPYMHDQQRGRMKVGRMLATGPMRRTNQPIARGRKSAAASKPISLSLQGTSAT